MGVARGRLFQWSASRFAQQQARLAGSAVRRVPHPPRLPMPTRAEKATASTRWRVFWPVGLSGTKKARLSDTLAHKRWRWHSWLNKVQVLDKGSSFIDLDFDRPLKYDVVNRLLMKQIPSSDEGFTIKLRAANGETEPETLEDMMSAHLDANPAAWAGDRDPCDNSTGSAPSPSAVAPHAAPASGTSAIASTPLSPVVASAACASRPPPAGLLALKLATSWRSPSPQGGLGKTLC